MTKTGPGTSLSFSFVFFYVLTIAVRFMFYLSSEGTIRRRVGLGSDDKNTRYVYSFLHVFYSEFSVLRTFIRSPGCLYIALSILSF